MLYVCLCAQHLLARKHHIQKDVMTADVYVEANVQMVAGSNARALRVARVSLAHPLVVIEVVIVPVGLHIVELDVEKVVMVAAQVVRVLAMVIVAQMYVEEHALVNVPVIAMGNAIIIAMGVLTHVREIAEIHVMMDA